MFLDDEPLRLVPKDSATGVLVGTMEKCWAQFWEAVGEPLKQACPPENVEVLKRTFMAGFGEGAKWAQRKGSN